MQSKNFSVISGSFNTVGISRSINCGLKKLCNYSLDLEVIPYAVRTACVARQMVAGIRLPNIRN